MAILCPEETSIEGLDSVNWKVASNWPSRAILLHDSIILDMSKEDALESPGWETRLGDGEISLEQHDLFAVRRIRVRIEEGY